MDVEKISLRAEPWSRYGAFIVDLLVLIVTGFVILRVGWFLLDWFPLGHHLTANALEKGLVTSALMIGVPLFAFSAMEGSALSATPGKRLTGIRLQGTDGRPLGVPRAVGRNGLKYAPVLIVVFLRVLPIRSFLLGQANRMLTVLAFRVPLFMAIVAGVAFAAIGISKGETWYDRLVGGVVVKRCAMAAEGSPSINPSFAPNTLGLAPFYLRAPGMSAASTPLLYAKWGVWCSFASLGIIPAAVFYIMAVGLSLGNSNCITKCRVVDPYHIFAAIGFTIFSSFETVSVLGIVFGAMSIGSRARQLGAGKRGRTAIILGVVGCVLTLIAGLGMAFFYDLVTNPNMFTF